MTDITITGHETKEFSFGVKHVISDGQFKYEFFQTKKDGTTTKAFEQWKTYELGVGKIVQAEVKETPETFVNKEGKTVNFTRRTILYFVGDEHQVPYQREAKQPDLEKRVERLEKQVFGAEEESIEF